jgi:hypothetical protein
VNFAIILARGLEGRKAQADANGVVELSEGLGIDLAQALDETAAVYGPDLAEYGYRSRRQSCSFSGCDKDVNRVQGKANGGSDGRDNRRLAETIRDIVLDDHGGSRFLNFVA